MEVGGYTYIIQSESHGRYYVESCVNVFARITDHERGNTPSTRNRGPWTLRYVEAYNTLDDARSREREIKRWKSRKMIEKIITEMPL